MVDEWHQYEGAPGGVAFLAPGKNSLARPRRLGNVPRASQQKHSPLKERGDDVYDTPSVAVEMLLRVERFPTVIWEPACGPGAIARVLRAAGHQVVASDLVDYGQGVADAGIDFLFERRARALAIVTNPPYKLADQFVRHALNLHPDKIAMLLRLVWLAGQRRKDLLQQLARVWIFSARLPRMHRDGWDGPKTSSSIDFAWFVWDREQSGPPTIGWI